MNISANLHKCFCPSEDPAEVSGRGGQDAADSGDHGVRRDRLQQTRHSLHCTAAPRGHWLRPWGMQQVRRQCIGRLWLYLPGARAAVSHTAASLHAASHDSLLWRLLHLGPEAGRRQVRCSDPCSTAALQHCSGQYQISAITSTPVFCSLDQG